LISRNIILACIYIKYSFILVKQNKRYLVEDGYPSVTDLGCGYKRCNQSHENQYFMVSSDTTTAVKIHR